MRLQATALPGYRLPLHRAGPRRLLPHQADDGAAGDCDRHETNERVAEDVFVSDLSRATTDNIWRMSDRVGKLPCARKRAP